MTTSIGRFHPHKSNAGAAGEVNGDYHGAVIGEDMVEDVANRRLPVRIDQTSWTSRRRLSGSAVAFGLVLAFVPPYAVYGDAIRALAQARGGGGQNPACALLTVEEVRKITGFQGYDRPSPGDDIGEGVGGGASCQYEAPSFAIDGRGNPTAPGKGPLLSVVLIEGKNYTQTLPVRQGCRKEPVPGVGETAFFEVCPASKLARTSPLYVKSGSRDFLFQLDIQAPDTEATLRPKLIGLAQAAVAKKK